ncbi:MAG: dolichyl-phosphate beta-glucosyltransferase [Candidatus Latescibacterota bacterium]|nr:dolichyl-phosphate beta-glucosyltransferase [Candidatus Latescibacterota bacterium]
MDLSIIVPAYNEEKRIGFTLGKTREFLEQRSWRYELILVDDGSRDQTVQVIQETAAGWDEIRIVQNVRNRGKGFSVRRGLEVARGRFVGFMDADYKTDISALDEVMIHLENNVEAVIGDRTLKATEILAGRSVLREFGSKTFKTFLRFLMGIRGFEDTQCGFKFFREDVMRQVFSLQKVEGYMFDVEILLILSRMNSEVRKLPVEWSYDADSRFNVISGTFKNLTELAGIRWRHRNGRYG